MHEAISDHMDEYKEALEHYSNLLMMETKNKLDIINARKRLNDAKDNLRVFELDLIDLAPKAI